MRRCHRIKQCLSTVSLLGIVASFVVATSSAVAESQAGIRHSRHASARLKRIQVMAAKRERWKQAPRTRATAVAPTQKPVPKQRTKKSPEAKVITRTASLAPSSASQRLLRFVGQTRSKAKKPQFQSVLSVQVPSVSLVKSPEPASPKREKTTPNKKVTQQENARSTGLSGFRESVTNRTSSFANYMQKIKKRALVKRKPQPKKRSVYTGAYNAPVFENGLYERRRRGLRTPLRLN